MGIRVGDFVRFNHETIQGRRYSGRVVEVLEGGQEYIVDVGAFNKRAQHDKITRVIR